MALLPIAGFPIAIVYLIAGARFGPLWGGEVVAGVTMVHLAGTNLVTRSLLRAHLKRFIEKPKRDAAEKPIVEALRKMGYQVTFVSGEDGQPDLLVRAKGEMGRRGHCVGLEVKGEKGTRTASQKESQWPIVKTVEQALKAIGVNL